MNGASTKQASKPGTLELAAREESETKTSGTAATAVLLARVILAVVFVYMGIHKVLHPVEFLKLVKQYDLVTGPPLLNLIAAILPWFEMFCGLL